MRLGREVTHILRAPSTEDAFGNPVPDWTAPTRIRVENSNLQPVVGDEETVGRDTVVTRWRYFAPYDTDLRSSDRIEHLDIDYEVDGDVQRWGSGARGYVSALLQKVT